MFLWPSAPSNAIICQSCFCAILQITEKGREGRDVPTNVSESVDQLLYGNSFRFPKIMSQINKLHILLVTFKTFKMTWKYTYAELTKSYRPENGCILSICENRTKEICSFLPRVMAPTATAWPLTEKDVKFVWVNRHNCEAWFEDHFVRHHIK